MRNVLFSFQGRIGRCDFWLTSLPLGLVHFVVESFLDGAAKNSDGVALTAVLLCLVWLPVFVWASLATQVKRWHDRDRSGWMVLINLIPLVGPLWAFIELGFLRGTVGANRFGRDPIEETEPARG
jgi:uncharacterized membrane protein YhaH (DUF805 family)